MVPRMTLQLIGWDAAIVPDLKVWRLADDVHVVLDTTHQQAVLSRTTAPNDALCVGNVRWLGHIGETGAIYEVSVLPLLAHLVGQRKQRVRPAVTTDELLALYATRVR